MKERLRIYTMTHKPFEIPKEPLYVPLQVGSALQEDLGYLRDDTGDNISAQNCYYSELTGLYWIWKNVKNLDYVGTCHYRRYLINDRELIFTEEEYLDLLTEFDLITTKRVHLNNSYHFGFSANHNIVALDTTGEVIRELFPDYYDTFVRLVNGPQTYFGNIFVTSKEVFDEYCHWLFTIFFEVQKRIDMETDEDSYHKRVFGFISACLPYVFTTGKGPSACACQLGTTAEKAETREMKQHLAAYLKAHDIDGAKEYFMQQHKLRPDILMEASDITGELHLAMQMIATADAEMKRYKSSILDTEDDFYKLVPFFAKLNRAVTDLAEGAPLEEDLIYIKNMPLSDVAIWVAVQIYPGKKGNKEELFKWLIQQRS